jgi:UPF0716 protein FxsA
MRYLFLLFIVMPIVEMWLLITVGAEIGALATISLVLLTALIGAQLLREQGFDTLWRGRRKLEEGQLPAQEIIEGIILAVSGALLLTPGFVTDIIGFAGLIPPLRVLFVKQMLRRMVVTDLHGNQFRPGAQGNQPGGDGVIEGESWEDKDGIDKPER